ncbi:DMT family transporter [Dysgonomonas sp. Marseille-P4677]|uniref:DMT family transporter n=1 Tax=Dysgonomonas sp. Marseille-P4677 TaxID=2364790 RepID=UPI001F1F8ECE|nr:DMT family transporter [Dysgonomonas sp. Marseille-P4677]
MPMTLTKKQQGNLIMVFVITIFGLNIPVNKYLYAEELLSPVAMTALRMSFAAIAFWLVSFFLPKEKIEKKDMLFLLLGGLCGMVFNQGLFAYGLGQTSPVDASIITTSSPLFAMIIAAVILKEPITWMKAGGVLVGGSGAIFLVYTSNHGNMSQDASLLGNMAIVGAQFFYAFYLVITRPLSNKYSSVTMMKWMFLYACIFALPFSFGDVLKAPLFYQTDKLPFLLLLFTLVGATFITYLLIPFAQRRIRPTTISMYNNMQPLIASIVAIYMGMDRFTFEKLIAAILIFGGVYLVTASKSRADMEEAVNMK